MKQQITKALTTGISEFFSMQNSCYKLFFLILLAVSCAPEKESRLSDAIISKCQHHDCEIKMADILQEDWDYLYIIKKSASLAEIRRVLGSYYSDYGKDTVLFVKNDTIVYFEDAALYPDEPKQWQIIFSTSQQVEKFSRHAAVFDVKFSNHFEHSYIELSKDYEKYMR